MVALLDDLTQPINERLAVGEIREHERIGKHRRDRRGIIQHPPSHSAGRLTRSRAHRGVVGQQLAERMRAAEEDGWLEQLAGERRARSAVEQRVNPGLRRDGPSLTVATTALARSVRHSRGPRRRVQRVGSDSGPSWSLIQRLRSMSFGTVPHAGQARASKTRWRVQIALQPSCQLTSQAPCSHRQCGQNFDERISTSCAWAACASVSIEVEFSSNARLV